jgi:hypothetical protein
LGTEWKCNVMRSENVMSRWMERDVMGNEKWCYAMWKFCVLRKRNSWAIRLDASGAEKLDLKE